MQFFERSLGFIENSAWFLFISVGIAENVVHLRTKIASWMCQKTPNLNLKNTLHEKKNIWLIIQQYSIHRFGESIWPITVKYSAKHKILTDRIPSNLCVLN